MTVTSPTLEQLRTLVAVADAGSFSAAARRLDRSQPVISYTIGTLEAQLGFALFVRGKRRPELTERGEAVLVYARRLCLLSDELTANTQFLRRGAETELSLAVDSLFPTERLAKLLRGLTDLYPSLPVRPHTVPLGGVLDCVLERQCMLGLSILTAEWPDLIEAREFSGMDIVPVAAADHPLAAHVKAAPISVVRKHLQLALHDPGKLTQHLDYSIAGVRCWRLTDLALKLALLRAGVGWGYMPLSLVEDDLKRGSLVKLALPWRPGVRQSFTMLHRLDWTPGPAMRWLMDRLLEWD
ncbi:MAG TPA: LysR family transcriptional regulator [Ideonella sp.]|nr:LysR family transcriptional regulator [Ideonella sp.]